MEKAFDRVSWKLILGGMEKLGFGEEMISLVRMLYDLNDPPQRRILVNGKAGQYFPIKSGVAQGCPLSPLLFLICAEVVIRLAKKNLKGIKVGNRRFQVSAFADDTVMFLNGIKDLRKVQMILRRYGEATGMKANLKKTEGLALGTARDLAPLHSEVIGRDQSAKEGDVIVSLGVPFGNAIDENSFWMSKYVKMKARISAWKSVRCRTQKGRILLSKMFVWSRFRYWNQSMIMPVEVLNAIQSDVDVLTWAKDPEFRPDEVGSTNKIRRWMNDKAAFIPWGRGGLGMLNYKEHVRALNARWALRYLDASTAPYKHVLDVYFKNEWAYERGVLLSTVPTSEILETLPNMVGFDYWRSVVRSFRQVGTKPMNIKKMLA